MGDGRVVVEDVRATPTFLAVGDGTDVGADTLSSYNTFVDVDADAGETRTMVLDWGCGALESEVAFTSTSG